MKGAVHVKGDHEESCQTEMPSREQDHKKGVAAGTMRGAVPKAGSMNTDILLENQEENIYSSRGP